MREILYYTQERHLRKLKAAPMRQTEPFRSAQYTSQPYRPTEQPTNSPTDKSANRPTNQPTDGPISQPTDQQTKRPTNQRADQATAQPTDRSANRPTNKPSDRPTEKNQATTNLSRTGVAVEIVADGVDDQGHHLVPRPQQKAHRDVPHVLFGVPIKHNTHNATVVTVLPCVCAQCVQYSPRAAIVVRRLHFHVRS